VLTVALSGGKPKLISATARSADWSRSGREIAVMAPDGIGIVDVASGSVRHVTDLTGAFLDWSPDDSTFVFVAESSVITVSAVDGSARTLARVSPPAPGDGPSCAGSVGPAKWSPDGLLIAYEARRCVDGRYIVSEIPIVNPEGVWQHQVDNLWWGFAPDYGFSDFVWSPDSRLFAFIDDALLTDNEVYLETAPTYPCNCVYKRLKAGTRGSLSWQRVPK